MAGVGVVPTEPASSGLLGPLARAQYAAVLALRWRLLVNSLRSSQGAFELGAKILSVLLYLFIGFSMAVGFGFGAYGMASEGEWRLLPILIWVVFLVWQVLPILLISFKQQFDLDILLRFPMRFSSYLTLTILFGVSDPSTIFGMLSLLGIWVGISVVNTALTLPLAALFLLYAAFNILLVRTVFAWIDRWLAQRKTREILSVIFFIGILSLQLLNPVWYTNDANKMASGMHGISPAVMHWLHLYQRWLPPGAVGMAVRLGGVNGGYALLLSQWTALLVAYTLVVVALLVLRLRAEFRGEILSDGAPARKLQTQVVRPLRQTIELPEAQTAADSARGVVIAVISKELSIMKRSAPILYTIIAPLIPCLLLVWKFMRGAVVAGFSSPLVMPACIAFTLLGFINLISNLFGTEGVGIQLYFMAPVRLRSVLLAKNLFYGALMMIEVVVVGLMVSLRMGLPHIDSLLTTIFWVLFALPCYYAAGNLLSVQFPYKMNLGRIGKRAAGSQANSLLSLLVQMVVTGIGASVLAPLALLGKLWVAIPILMLLAAGAIALWHFSLKAAEKIAQHRMEKLTSIFARAD
jgi:ABC-2 type transport system permease protein